MNKVIKNGFFITIGCLIGYTINSVIHKKTKKDESELIKFKITFFEMMTYSRYCFLEGTFFFEGKEYPDIECVITYKAFDLSANTGKLFENVCKIIIERHYDYFKEIEKKYMLEQSEKNYKIIGDLVVPIIFKEAKKLQNGKEQQKPKKQPNLVLLQKNK